MKLRNTIVQADYTSSDLVKYVGPIPACALTGDCQIDETQLTYLLDILLQRYCETTNVLDTDISVVDIQCLIADNPDIIVPASITIETLTQYLVNHICALYESGNNTANKVNNINGIVCVNDTVTLNENTFVNINPLVNDVLIDVSGTPVVTIVSPPSNGIYTVSANIIKYVPNPNFVGNDSMVYQVTKGGYTCTGAIYLNVITVITEATINDIVLAELINLLSSNQYWDLGIPVGAKMAISNTNLPDFYIDANPLSTTSGYGLPGTKWAKWAVANGNNGTEDFTRSTLRGYDESNSDYNYSTASGGADSKTLGIGEIPPHRHIQTFFGTYQATNQADWLLQNTTYTGSAASTIIPMVNTNLALSADTNASTYVVNTGDGTANLSDEGELNASPNSFSLRNAYKTLILVQKIA